MIDGLLPDLVRLAEDLFKVLLAFALALPIAWERGHGAQNTGFRTLPVVAMAACGFSLIIATVDPGEVEARARVLQGIITGIGFIGGGAILKHNGSVHGLVTAATVWNAGAIGVAVGFGRVSVAVVLSLVNFASLLLLARLDGGEEQSEEED
ncbi:MgtC/SapB family protein [Glycocaulis profundi]|nr:MgtC/SapB family protein [Glycocaulis profundi]